MKIVLVLIMLMLYVPQACIASAVQGTQQQQAAQQAAIQKAIQEGQLRPPRVQQQITIEGPAPMIELPRADDSEIRQISDITLVMDSLRTSSRIWPLIADMEPKIFIVMEHMRMFYESGIILQKSPALYVSLIDEMSYTDPKMLDLPLINILQVLAIVEYDFDNGQDPDKLAREILGSHSAWVANRQRLGLQ